MSTKTKALGDAIYAVVTDITPSWATVLACGRASKIWDAYYDVDFSDESKGLEIVALEEPVEVGTRIAHDGVFVPPSALLADSEKMFICIPRDGTPDVDTYPVDTESQCDAAREALAAVGLTSAEVYAGEPDGSGDAHKNGRILFA